MKTTLGLDIGGANLKLADGRGFAVSRPFALWREPARLADVLTELIGEAPPAGRLAVTMTGELADCFRTKREGVEHIVQAVAAAAAAREINDVRVYLTDGSLVVPAEATRRPLEAAASNWHVLARYAARWLPGGNGLLIDIGSTTCDIIPLHRGTPATQGKTDPDRLAAGELVYTGVWRSPVCAVVSELPWRGSQCPVAQELFATTLDAYLLLGELPEAPDNCQTADGRPATRTFAHDRLARMLCADGEIFDQREALSAAQAIREAQLQQVTHALRRVMHRMSTPPEACVISGEGEFLARASLHEAGFRGRMISLNAELDARVSRAAPAHALAVLAAEG